ncbi:MAG: hypothetical protein KDE46_06865 [Caldilineaceae bacterium]|nr:hypothetical protein [Caldilineaceae bacterium]
MGQVDELAAGDERNQRCAVRLWKFSAAGPGVVMYWKDIRKMWAWPLAQTANGWPSLAPSYRMWKAANR